MPVLVELFVALAQQVAVLRAQALVIERPVDHDEQLVDLERLLQVVERAELHRLDRALDRGVRGHQQDLRPIRRRRATRPARGSGPGRSARASGCRRAGRRTMPRASSRCASRGLPIDTTSCPSSRSACARALRIFASSSTSRIEPVVLVMLLAWRRAGSSMRTSVPRRRLAGDGDPAPKSLDDVPGDRKTDAGSGAAGGEVRIEDPRQVLRRDARPVVGDGDRDAAVVERGPSGAGTSAGPFGPASTAWRALLDDVDQRLTQPLAVGDRRPAGPGSSARRTPLLPAAPSAARTASRASAFRSAAPART